MIAYRPRERSDALSHSPALIVLQEDGNPVVGLKARLKEANRLDAGGVGQGVSGSCRPGTGTPASVERRFVRKPFTGEQDVDS